MSDYLFSLFVVFLLISIDHSGLNHIVLSTSIFLLWIPNSSLRLLEGEYTSSFNLYLTIKQKKHHHGSSLINKLRKKYNIA